MIMGTQYKSLGLLLTLALLFLTETRFAAVAQTTPEPFLNGVFPPGFIWGAATAAYQVEGGWNASGKGPSIWDTFTHQVPNPISENGTGDVAADSYHLWHTDIQLLVTHYRFSISWSRLLPTGRLSGGVNPDGLWYYADLISNLTANGIQPMVTLYHWDLPQALEDMGGWLNPSIADWFNDYATVCFQQFGSQVKQWITFNEPWVFTLMGYGDKNMAPGLNRPATAPYQAAHNVLLAHAKAWRTYDQQFRPTQKGKIGITLNCDYKVPGTTDQKDIDATYRAMQFQLGWFAHPIFKGDYPPIMKSQVASRSRAQGMSTSRLPSFTPEQIQLIYGTSDFFGLNMYTSFFTYDSRTPLQPPSIRTDDETYANQSESWLASGSSWLKSNPRGARQLLNWVKNEYNNPPIIITENGWSDNTGSTEDTSRVNYYRQYLDQILKAHLIDGVDVRGYVAWSLVDNFEWASGYTEKFGLHYVNFSDPARPRVPKLSAKFFTSVILNNGFPAASFTPAPWG